MTGYENIHSLVPDLDPATRAELTKQLTILEADTIESVLSNVELYEGDSAAEHVRDECYPDLEAMLRGETTT
ncbi:hypothetical protein [Streptomyces olivaceus]